MGNTRPSTPAQPDLSPLDQIRNTEAENSGRLAAAREAAAETLAQAKAGARRLVEEAGETGRAEGEMRRAAMLDEAREEARTIIGRAHQGARDLRRIGARRLDSAVAFSVRLILGDLDAPETTT